MPIRHLRLAIVFTFFVATLTACDNPTSGASSSGGSGGGTLTVQGTEHELTKLYIDHEGYDSFGGSYDIDLLIYSQEVSYDGSSNNGSTDGSGVALDMTFAADQITSGSYPYDAFEGANTFSDFSDAFTSPGSYREYFSAGTVEITVDGTNYTIEGDVTDDIGNRVTFSYNGPVTEEFPADG